LAQPGRARCQSRHLHVHLGGCLWPSRSGALGAGRSVERPSVPRSGNSTTWAGSGSPRTSWWTQAPRPGRELRRRARDRRGSSRSRARASSPSSGSPRQTRAPAARTPPRDDVSGQGTAGSAAMAGGWRGFPGELLVQAATLGGLARVSGLQERGPASAPVRDGGLQRVVSHAGWKSRSMLRCTRCCPRFIPIPFKTKMSNSHCFHRAQTQSARVLFQCHPFRDTYGMGG